MQPRKRAGRNNKSERKEREGETERSQHKGLENSSKPGMNRSGGEGPGMGGGENGELGAIPPSSHPHFSIPSTFSLQLKHSQRLLLSPQGTCRPWPRNQPPTSLAPWLDPFPLRKECGPVNKGPGEAAPCSQDPLMWHGLGAHRYRHLSRLLDKRAICHHHRFPGKHPRGGGPLLYGGARLSAPLSQ